MIVSLACAVKQLVCYSPSMAKIYYAQRLPQESIDRLKDYAEKRGMKPAQAMEAIIGAAHSLMITQPQTPKPEPVSPYVDMAAKALGKKTPKPAGKVLGQFKVTVKIPMTKPGGKLL